MTQKLFVQRKMSLKITPENATPTEVFYSVTDDQIINLIVTETNLFAQQKIRTAKKTKSGRINSWTPTTYEKVKKCLGLTLWMLMASLSSLTDYWSTKHTTLIYHDTNYFLRCYISATTRRLLKGIV